MKPVTLVFATLLIGSLSVGAHAAPLANGGANGSLVPTIQTNVNAPTNVQIPINVLGNQQAVLVNNQNTNQLNQNTVGNAAAAKGGLANASNTGLLANNSPARIGQFF